MLKVFDTFDESPVSTFQTPDVTNLSRFLVDESKLRGGKNDTINLNFYHMFARMLLSCAEMLEGMFFLKAQHLVWKKFHFFQLKHLGKQAS